MIKIIIKQPKGMNILNIKGSIYRNIKSKIIMKKILFSSIIGLTLILSGCENNFDPQIYGSLFSNNFPKTEADCESYLMTCYLPFMNAWSYNYGGANQQGFYLATGGVIRMFDSPSDVGNPCTIGSWGSTWLQFSQANFNQCVL